MHTKSHNFALENFEGPLDFLLYLIQKEEIDIYEVSLLDLVNQCLEKLSEWKERRLELGAEFIGTMAYFVLLKSRMLLPQTEEPLSELELEEDPHFEIIHHLLDYCKFKQAAKDLGKRHEQQFSHYYRGITPSQVYQKPLGIHHLSIEELTVVFKDLVRKADKPISSIYEENWKVSDKVKFIKTHLQKKSFFLLHELFGKDKSRLELIVTFLALLELMKLGVVAVGRQNEEDSEPRVFEKKETE